VLHPLSLHDALPISLESVHVHEDAVDITGSGPYSIRLASGQTLQTGGVVMATGNFPRSLAATRSCTNATAIDNSWDYEAIATIPPDADTCIIAAGLTMADAVVSLARHGHCGRIAALSRHGLLPLAHPAGRGAPVAGDEP